MIIWLASFPRSGNTYLRQLMKDLCGVSTFSVYDDPVLVRQGVAESVGHVRIPGGDLRRLDEKEGPSFVKTHDLPSDENPSIYVVRDGRDALVSFAHFRLRFDVREGRRRMRSPRRRFLRELERLVANFTPWGGWSDHVVAWTRSRNPGLTYIVKYEDLVRDPTDTLTKALEGVGAGLSVKAANTRSFEEMHRLSPDLFRRGVVGSWRSEMPPKIESMFWRLHGETMDQLDYPRLPAAIG